MLRKGIIGYVARLMPVFEGFDQQEEIDLSPDAMSDDEINAIDNIRVTLLPESPNRKFVKQGVCPDCGKPEQQCECVCSECNLPAGECVCGEQNASGNPIGSAGNSLISEEPEAQMGAIGGIGKGLSIQEASTAEGSVIDDSGMKLAQKLHSENSMEKVMDMFNQFSVVPSHRVKFDMDTSKPMNTVAAKPIRKIPKGW